MERKYRQMIKMCLKQLSELIALLQENELTADKIICSGSDLTVVFGNVRVSLGSASYEDEDSTDFADIAKIV